MSRKVLIWTLPLICMFLSWTSIDVNAEKRAEELKVADELVSLVNKHRASIGLPELIRNETADKLADKHSRYMIEKQNVNHDFFVERWDTLEAKENAEEVTENSGVDADAESALSASLKNSWLKANVEGDFTHTGISVKKDEDGNFYYTQIFFKK